MKTEFLQRAVRTALALALCACSQKDAAFLKTSGEFAPVTETVGAAAGAGEPGARPAPDEWREIRLGNFIRTGYFQPSYFSDERAGSYDGSARPDSDGDRAFGDAASSGFRIGAGRARRSDVFDARGDDYARAAGADADRGWIRVNPYMRSQRGYYNSPAEGFVRSDRFGDSARREGVDPRQGGIRTFRFESDDRFRRHGSIGSRHHFLSR